MNGLMLFSCALFVSRYAPCSVSIGWCASVRPAARPKAGGQWDDAGFLFFPSTPFSFGTEYVRWDSGICMGSELECVLSTQTTKYVTVGV
ncbi:hypothetical protein LY78DRAFT_659382 [Colletotrichum sublineola]|nr:hypothetical protein LY78DRAFT_659382 [Colletotrichum sublineola]